MKRPAVLQVITSTGFGGSERALERLVLGLRERFAFEILSVKEMGGIGERLREAGIRVESLGGGGGLGALRAGLRLSRELERRKPDLVHAWLFQANLLARFTARLAQVPNLSSIRTLEREKRWQPLLDALTWPLVDRHLAVSRAAARFTARAGVPASRIEVVPNGLTPEELRLDPRDERMRARWDVGPEELLLLCAGRLRWEKGQAILLEALALLLEEDPSCAVRLVVAGEGEDEASLRHRAELLDLEEHVRWAGLVEDLRPLLRAADLLVLPSRWEGMPNVVLEAAAQETPAVASKVGGVPEIVLDGRTGVLVPPGDASALHEALSRLCRNPEAIRRMGRRSREHVLRRFPLDRVLEATDRIYRELLGSTAS